MAEHKKLTVDEFKRRVKEALHGPLPGANGQRRLGQSGVIRDLLKGTKLKSPVKEPPVGER